MSTRVQLATCLLVIATLAWGCAGDDEAGPPRATGFRPGDSLLDRLHEAHLTAFPDSLLPPELAALGTASSGQGVWQVPAGQWQYGTSLPDWIADSLSADRDATVWVAATPPSLRVPLDQARLIMRDELLVPHTWTPSSVIPSDTLAWTDAARSLVVTWGTRRGTVSVVSIERPGALRVEYPLDPSTVLAPFTRARPAAVTELLERTSFARVEQRGLRLPATGIVEWDIPALVPTALEVHVAVGDASWTERDGLLQLAPRLGDGVTFAVDIVDAGVTTRAWSLHLQPGQGWHTARVDLAAWTGRDVTLRLVSEPGPAGDAAFDEAFWAGLRLRGGVTRRSARPNIVLVDIDTLRADRLGATGHVRNTSPRLDRWVASTGASVFSDCLATSSWTLPSTMSLLTGLHVFQHGVSDGGQALPASVPTLAGLLRDAGYETMAWVEGGYVSARHGFGRGFDSYDASAASEPDWTRIAEWMADRGSEQPAFVFLQTYMVHAPYLHDDQFWSGTANGELPFDGEGVRAGNVLQPFQRGLIELDDRERLYVDRMYDAGVRRMDDVLGALLESLDAKFSRDELMVVITSDHGEELFEHGGMSHGRTLYEEVLQVPLIVRWPRPESPSTATPRALLDVAPTLLEQAGVAVPSDWPGRPLLQAPGPSPLRIAQLGAWGVMVQRGPFKVINMASLPGGGRATRAELFDLSADAGEQRNLAGSRRDILEELLGWWRDYRQRNDRPEADSALAEPMDAEALEALRELGYIDDR
jgi:arylsulfatase A-like enzyme